jgi:hypothetical protein
MMLLLVYLKQRQKKSLIARVLLTTKDVAPAVLKKKSVGRGQPAPVPRRP